MTRLKNVGMEDFAVDIDKINSEWPTGADAGDEHPDEATTTDEVQQEVKEKTNPEVVPTVVEIDPAAAPEVSPEVTEVTSEVEEIAPTEEEIGELTESLESAQNLIGRIKNAGGMSLTFGLESHRLFPNQFNVPLNQFTSKTSPVRYNASLESLNEIATKIQSRLAKAKK